MKKTGGRLSGALEVLARLERHFLRMEGKLNRALGMELGDARRDKAMAKGQENLNREIGELKEAVEAHLADQAQQVERAVAEARAAWEAEDDKAFENAANQLDEIAASLKKPAPFDPSANR